MRGLRAEDVVGREGVWWYFEMSRRRDDDDVAFSRYHGEDDDEVALIRQLCFFRDALDKGSSMSRGIPANSIGTGVVYGACIALASCKCGTFFFSPN